MTNEEKELREEFEEYLPDKIYKSHQKRIIANWWLSKISQNHISKKEVERVIADMKLDLEVFYSKIASETVDLLRQKLLRFLISMIFGIYVGFMMSLLFSWWGILTGIVVGVVVFKLSEDDSFLGLDQ